MVNLPKFGIEKVLLIFTDPNDDKQKVIRLNREQFSYVLKHVEDHNELADYLESLGIKATIYQ